jgi:dTDP-4-amino-4,6-dideoxygalactose transaminase
MEPILNWAEKNNVKVIEDCAQAFGAKVNGKFAGTFGDIGCFSFYPTKNLGGIGDGGAIVASAPKIVRSVRNLKQYGWRSRYDISEKNGRNSRLDAINAAVLSAKLKEIDADNVRRREIYASYLEADSGGEIFQNRNLDESNVVHLAVGITQSPKKLIQFFENKGIEVGQHYPIPDSKQTGLTYASEIRPTPKAILHCESNVSFPIFPHMNNGQVRSVSRAISDWLENGR